MPALNSSPTSSSARPGVEQHVGLRRGLRRRAGSRQVDRVRVAVEQREAVQEERRRERAEQEVLDRGLLREQPAAPGHAGHQVQRQRQHLERDEHQQQVVRDREDQHAADREQQRAGRPRSARGRCAQPRGRRGEPTTTAADATIGLPSTLRSAISSTDMTARIEDRALDEQARRRRRRASRRRQRRRRAGRARSSACRAAATAASAPSRPAIVRPTCTREPLTRAARPPRRARRRSAAPSTMRIGHRAW